MSGKRRPRARWSNTPPPPRAEELDVALRKYEAVTLPPRAIPEAAEEDLLAAYSRRQNGPLLDYADVGARFDEESREEARDEESREELRDEESREELRDEESREELRDEESRDEDEAGDPERSSDQEEWNARSAAEAERGERYSREVLAPTKVGEESGEDAGVRAESLYPEDDDVPESPRAPMHLQVDRALPPKKASALAIVASVLPSWRVLGAAAVAAVVAVVLVRARLGRRVEVIGAGAAAAPQPTLTVPIEFTEPPPAGEAPPAENASAPELARYERTEAVRALEARKIPEALELAQQAVEHEPAEAEAWLILGAAHLYSNDFASARRAFKACVEQAKTARRDECAALVR